MKDKADYFVLSEKEHFNNYLFYGGYDCSERCVLGMFTEYVEKV